MNEELALIGWSGGCPIGLSFYDCERVLEIGFVMKDVCCASCFISPTYQPTAKPQTPNPTGKPSQGPSTCIFNIKKNCFFFRFYVSWFFSLRNKLELTSSMNVI